jgi:hypothetical protein
VLSAALLLLTLAGETAAVRGVVRDALTGEPLARVRLRLAPSAIEALSDAGGRFELAGAPPGSYTLQGSTVGYRTAEIGFSLGPGEIREFELALSPDVLRRSDSIEVRAGPFEPLEPASPAELALDSHETKNLASVLADDPLRAVQALPGVRSNDDFDSRFSLRGAPFERVGLYLDDVLLHAPFHMVGGEATSGALTAFQGDMLDSLALHTAAFPARFGDRTAGVLDARTREGSRRRPSLRATASASNASVLGEGPFGRRRGAWMAAVRKSYLQYIIERTAKAEPTLAFGFLDAQIKLTLDAGMRHQFSLFLMDGLSDLDRTRSRARLGVNSPMLGEYRPRLANLGWRYSPQAGLLLTSRAAFLQERFDNRNRDELPLGAGTYGEWSWSVNGSWLWRGAQPLDFGGSARRIRAEGVTNQYQLSPFLARRLDEYRGRGVVAGGYAQQAFSAAAGRLHLAAGARWDRLSTNGAVVVSPRLSLAMAPSPATRIQLGWGHYAQFPDLAWLFSPLGRRTLLPERSIHYFAAIERRFGERSRLRLEFYDRQERDLLFRPLLEPRALDGRFTAWRLDAPVENSIRGYARGLELFFQRRTANGLTGWVSYSLGYSRLRDGATGAVFPADYDQRHGVNVYLGRRVRSSVHLSARWVYGSGFPIPGYLRREQDRYYVSDSRNALRLRPYHRLDLRVNKAFLLPRGKLTLYGEIVNLLNRDNYRFSSFNGYNARTGQASLSLDRMFPILPSAGLVVDF